MRGSAWIAKRFTRTQHCPICSSESFAFLTRWVTPSDTVRLSRRRARRGRRIRSTAASRSMPIVRSSTLAAAAETRTAGGTRRAGPRASRRRAHGLARHARDTTCTGRPIGNRHQKETLRSSVKDLHGVTHVERRPLDVLHSRHGAAVRHAAAGRRRKRRSRFPRTSTRPNRTCSLAGRRRRRSGSSIRSSRTRRLPAISIGSASGSSRRRRPN